MWPAILLSGVLAAGNLVPAQANPLPRESSIAWAPCSLDIPGIDWNKTDKRVSCGTVKVPLDYTNPSSGQTIDIQLLRLDSPKKDVKRSVLFNPGGPGESGVESVLHHGSHYQKILKDNFNIIGFDPRGTGRTIPFHCGEPRNEEELSLTPLLIPETSEDDYWPELRDKYWEKSGDDAGRCTARQSETGRFIGTAFTARDMLAITDALGEDGKLRYWGFSYGTVLGQTFAAMFPERVDRMFLDAAVPAEEYFTNAVSESAQDVEKSLDNILWECFNVKGRKDKDGRALCPLAEHTQRSDQVKQFLAEDIDKWTNMTDLPRKIARMAPDKDLFPYGGPSYVSQLKSKIIDDLKSVDGYLRAANRIELFIEGDLLQALGLREALGLFPKPSGNHGKDAFQGIQCSDSPFRVSDPYDFFSLMQDQLDEGSFSDVFVSGPLMCARWGFHAAESVDPSLFRRLDAHYNILFASSGYDPVAPLDFTWDASSRFTGSRVLVHNGVGHGVTGHTSNCTNTAISEYFLTGDLPIYDTVCEPDEPAFVVAARRNKQQQLAGKNGQNGKKTKDGKKGKNGKTGQNGKKEKNGSKEQDGKKKMTDQKEKIEKKEKTEKNGEKKKTEKKKEN
ncbi:Tripeptidyl aminopeptidase [Fusarium albosuccineum]|uniref:Tripeptidyl aminopeptidase n=1 Tax=Fusarium albosuccineum TaxID=1237068 RepID=A0A8H4P116_9HYPO|nr:Tripeptidyl aminopeptidase [Fusarium albosuccineum]